MSCSLGLRATRVCIAIHRGPSFLSRSHSWMCYLNTFDLRGSQCPAHSLVMQFLSRIDNQPAGQKRGRNIDLHNILESWVRRIEFVFIVMRQCSQLPSWKNVFSLPHTVPALPGFQTIDCAVVWTNKRWLQLTCCLGGDQ